MCVTNDEETVSDSSTGTYSYSNGVEQVVVTAPRISLDMNTVSNIDWSQVGMISFFGAVNNLYSGAGAFLLGGLTGGLIAIEAQPDVSILDLFQTANDLITIEGYPAPYVPLY
jgi:hypothetical protein